MKNTNHDKTRTYKSSKIMLGTHLNSWIIVGSLLYILTIYIYYHYNNVHYAN